jgi:hypothetical protein
MSSSCASRLACKEMWGQGGGTQLSRKLGAVGVREEEEEDEDRNGQVLQRRAVA